MNNSNLSNLIIPKQKECQGVRKLKQRDEFCSSTAVMHVLWPARGVRRTASISPGLPPPWDWEFTGSAVVTADWDHKLPSSTWHRNLSRKQGWRQVHLPESHAWPLPRKFSPGNIHSHLNPVMTSVRKKNISSYTTETKSAETFIKPYWTARPSWRSCGSIQPTRLDYSCLYTPYSLICKPRNLPNYTKQNLCHVGKQDSRRYSRFINASRVKQT